MNSTRITITISPDVKGWLQKHKEYINISGVCQSAILFAVTRQEFKDSGNFMARLALEKLGEPHAKGFKDAFDDVVGMTYQDFTAIQNGSFPEFMLEERFSTHAFCDWWNHYYLMGWKSALRLIWDKYIKTQL
ncbi:hypothetical protein [Allocoleopsis sp.]|uniref:hypothetical protein n=1 Tax=Allocoleopsis sp. TaxID=3088169 RepID=UPI002FCFB788